LLINHAKLIKDVIILIILLCRGLVMGFEYLDLIETVDRLHELCEELNIKDVIKGNAKQIEIVAEIKERIESMEIERISAIDLGIIPYEA